VTVVHMDFLCATLCGFLDVILFCYVWQFRKPSSSVYFHWETDEKDFYEMICKRISVNQKPQFNMTGSL
jgi:hypothetical protein